MALTVVSALTIPTLGVFAATSAHSGSVEVSKSKISPLTVQYVGGGTWNYGFVGTEVYSQYDHNGVIHSSAVSNSNPGSLTSSGWQDPGVTAYVAIQATLTGNQAFWNTD
jgi:lactococcin 972 family bacteriocin